MKWFPVFVLWMLVVPGFAQQDPEMRSSARKRSRLSPGAAELAQQLTLNCTTELQKVKAIFYWITDNIAYRTRPVTRSGRNHSFWEEADDHDSIALKPLDERVAERVLYERVAVCDGYARLFKTLCTYSGLQSEVIQGYARTDASRRIQRFQPNHSWNAVVIDSVWYLLDVTWASGYISWRGNEFIRHRDEQYFLTRPADFIREHYPDNLQWALMDDPPLMPEFRHSPFKQKSFTKYQITAYRPEKGVIEVMQGDTILVELHTSDAMKDGRVSSDPFLDTSVYNTAGSVLLTPVGIGNRILYSYVASSPAVQWLYILYNDDLILRYRLKVNIATPPGTAHSEIR